MTINNPTNGEEETQKSTNIVDVHDPFFLWGLLEHSDRTLIQADRTLSDDDRSRLYWSCYYHKRSEVCDYILTNYEMIRTARDAIRKLSEMTEAGGKDEPDLTAIPVPFLLPTTPDFTVNEFRDGSFVASKGKPLKFTVVNKTGQTKTCIYKHGDKLLQDALCIGVMKEMNYIFAEEKIDAEVVLYEVLPVEESEGLIECVDNSHPFLEFQNSDKDSNALKDFIDQSPERRENLFRTFLGFIVSGYVLELADRHDDNIMITDDGKILHIDFGCAFGQKTKLERILGLFMDIPNSPFSEDVFIAMIGENADDETITYLWQTLKERVWLCFNALRTHKNRFKPIGDENYKHLHTRLMIELPDAEARQAFESELEKCYNNRFNSARAHYYKLQQNLVS